MDEASYERKIEKIDKVLRKEQKGKPSSMTSGNLAFMILIATIIMLAKI